MLTLIELTGPAQTSYTAPATHQLCAQSGVTSTGPKAEHLEDTARRAAAK
jgi:hypothetical protein